ncbi:MAG TPA: hypothetical protein VE984_12175 [Gaiellaceae bacterium]|nr:hypothetical protein [Gaiellaceae bacterium]
MSFLDRLRKMLAGPAHVQAADDAEAAALREEFGATADEGAADLKHVEGAGGGGRSPDVRFGASEAAEAAEADLASEEAPPDPS